MVFFCFWGCWFGVLFVVLFLFVCSFVCFDVRLVLLHLFCNVWGLLCFVWVCFGC